MSGTKCHPRFGTLTQPRLRQERLGAQYVADDIITRVRARTVAPAPRACGPMPAAMCLEIAGWLIRRFATADENDLCRVKSGNMRGRASSLIT